MSAVFSKKDKNSLMWSHYADGMRGLCIVYDQQSLHNSGIKLSEIKYVESVIKTNIYDLKSEKITTTNPNDYDANFILNHHEIYKHSYFKHLNWKYEEETRSIITNKDDIFESNGQIIKINDDTIKAVIIGNKMPRYNQDIIKMICKNKKIPIYLSEPNLRNFSVSYKEIKN
ncbi:DUF2971 domain-containing protein [Photobacterium kishitanii]|uniref:DUF2971 domain-containing protein n=1 Tax=Photobacterium kishitanii TaxID=318456 RepID=UPI00273868F9|nr:DUF2971 domain-containing protein [Photobacterium kishitanii]